MLPTLPVLDAQCESGRGSTDVAVVITVLRGEEATVKWLRREGTTVVRLRSQNGGYEYIVVPAGAVSVRTLLVILQKPHEATSPSSRQLGE